MPVIHITVNYFSPRGQIVTEIAHAWIVLTVHFQNFLGHKRWPHMFSLITHECEDKKLFYKNNNKCHFIFINSISKICFLCIISI